MTNNDKGGEMGSIMADFAVTSFSNGPKGEYIW